MGFPTANLMVTPNKLIPARGVYAAMVEVDGKRYMGAVNVGFRPTFGGDRMTVEAFVLDFQGDLYGHNLALDFVARLRDERTYPDAEALALQIAIDVAQVRRRLDQPDQHGSDTRARP